MFRITSKTLRLVHNVLKATPKVFIDKANRRAIVQLPDSFVSKAFYGNDAKQAPKSPLGNLIAKEKPQPDPVAEEPDGKETKEQSWRRMKYTFVFFGVSFTCVGIYLIMELGRPRIGEDGIEVTDQFSKMPIWKQYILRTITELNYYRLLIKEPSREKLLPDMIKHQYYAPSYTLVLEFTDVLVHPEWTYSTGWRFKKRPGLDHFLETLSGTYEIVVYTAEQGMTVFPIMEALDPKNHINYKLVRDATLFVDGMHVKDIDKLNRDLNRTIVVDWDGNSTKYHPENVFQIPRWKGNDDDITLIHLAAFLLAIAQNDINDIREVIKYYNEFDDPLATFREKQKKLIELAEQANETPVSESRVKKWTPSFLRKII